MTQAQTEAQAQAQTRPTSRPAGNIYDLGYRTYEGERLGRKHAFQSLFLYSLRGCFGIGRSAMNKVFPFGLAGLALLPAFAQLTFAALAPQDLELWTAENYFSYVEIVLGLFAAAVAPDLIGRDQRNRTLPLYFSRALLRRDYVSAKVAALIVAMLAVQLVPHAVLMVGAAMATEDFVGHLMGNAGDIPPIVASSFVVAVLLTGLSLALASFTANRALATGVVLGYQVIMATLAGAIMEAVTGRARQLALLMSPYDVLEGTVAWMFGSAPQPDKNIVLAGQGDYWVYFVAALAYVAVTLALVYRRYQRMVV